MLCMCLYLKLVWLLNDNIYFCMLAQYRLPHLGYSSGFLQFWWHLPVWNIYKRYRGENKLLCYVVCLTHTHTLSSKHIIHMNPIISPYMWVFSLLNDLWFIRLQQFFLIFIYVLCTKLMCIFRLNWAHSWNTSTAKSCKTFIMSFLRNLSHWIECDYLRNTVSTNNFMQKSVLVLFYEWGQLSLVSLIRKTPHANTHHRLTTKLCLTEPSVSCAVKLSDSEEQHNIHTHTTNTHRKAWKLRWTFKTPCNPKLIFSCTC